jgi:hypothetical protein
MIGLIAAVLVASSPSQTELTIYNQGFGLVKEVRELKIRKGRQEVAIEDVAAQIEPTSVGFRILGTNSFSILEQNYQYDLINSQAILNKSVGQHIRFIRTIGGKKESLEGVLLSAPTAIDATVDGQQQQSQQETFNGMVIKTDDGRIVLDPTGEIEVSSIPAGLISRPTLKWDIESTKDGTEPVELSYISQGLTWNADYVLTLDGQGSADMQGWVTLANTSGATWIDARLKLLAGDVNRVQPQSIQVALSAAAAPATVSAPSFKEESLFEYHLYTLQRPTTVRNNETKQVSLLEGHGIPVRKKLIIDSITEHYYPSEGEVGTGDVKPQVRLEFLNELKSGLGMPLPKGNVKVYQRDKSGSVQLLGEDSIDHTPRNEKISLNVGRSFDVVSTRKRLAFKELRSQAYREQFEIEVRNRKQELETVYVLERHYGDWRITDKSQPFDKLDSNTAQFVVSLQPNEVKKVRYTVETKW